MLVTMVTVLGSLAHISPTTRAWFFAIAGLWLAAVVTVGALGGFAAGSLGVVPAPVVAFLVLLVTLFGTWTLSRSFREAVLSIPLPALVGLNVGRLGGVFFLLLAAAGRLSNPFASSAGWGDILVASLAAVLTIALLTGITPRAALRAWNILGTLDLLAAVTFGALSANGAPWRVFTEGPGSHAITQLPWVFIPTMIVPVFLLIHFVVGKKLKAMRMETTGTSRHRSQAAGVVRVA
jgi:hypothetical protein